MIHQHCVALPPKIDALLFIQVKTLLIFSYGEAQFAHRAISQSRIHIALNAAEPAEILEGQIHHTHVGLAYDFCNRQGYIMHFFYFIYT